MFTMIRKDTGSTLAHRIVQWPRVKPSSVPMIYQTYQGLPDETWLTYYPSEGASDTSPMTLTWPCHQFLFLWYDRRTAFRVSPRCCHNLIQRRVWSASRADLINLTLAPARRQLQPARDGTLWHVDPEWAIWRLGCVYLVVYIIILVLCMFHQVLCLFF